MTKGKEAAPPQWLWDLLPVRKRPPKRRRDRNRDNAPPRRNATSTRTQSPARQKQQQRYDRLVRRMKQQHAVRVTRWRASTTGCAWQVRYADGTISRLIEAPYPRGPMSAAVFLHEVGHHAIGFDRYKPRCLEEYMAWQWALGAMGEYGINITDRVRRRIDNHLRYAVHKARRRGLKKLPAELAEYATLPTPGRVAPASAKTPQGALLR